jgi:hypothetical protein
LIFQKHILIGEFFNLFVHFIYFIVFILYLMLLIFNVFFIFRKLLYLKRKFSLLVVTSFHFLSYLFYAGSHKLFILDYFLFFYILLGNCLLFLFDLLRNVFIYLLNFLCLFCYKIELLLFFQFLFIFVL